MWTKNISRTTYYFVKKCSKNPLKDIHLFHTPQHPFSQGHVVLPLHNSVYMYGFLLNVE